MPENDGFVAAYLCQLSIVFFPLCVIILLTVVVVI